MLGVLWVLWDARAYQWGASGLRCVEGLGLGLGPLPGCPPSSLPLATTAKRGGAQGGPGWPPSATGAPGGRHGEVGCA